MHRTLIQIDQARHGERTSSGRGVGDLFFGYPPLARFLVGHQQGKMGCRTPNLKVAGSCNGLANRVVPSCETTGPTEGYVGCTCCQCFDSNSGSAALGAKLGTHMVVGQNPAPLVNIKIGGTWVFIHCKMEA